MCGLKIPEMMVGRDFLWSTDGKSDQTSSIYTEGRMSQLKPLKNQKSLFRVKYGAWRSVITSEYKLVVDYTGKVQRLSDLKNDPFELRNLAYITKHAVLQKELLNTLREYARVTGDPFPNPVPKAPTSFGNKEG